MDAQQNTFSLPIAVISPTDIARLLREVENLDEYFRQATIRSGSAPEEAPRYSRLLDAVVVDNKLNLLQENDRQLIVTHLENLAEYAPVLHISFSVDPPGPYVQKIVAWLRQNIDGFILVRVGLQPNIGAGCVVRSENKSFDFSLRKFFDSKRDFFAQKLHEVVQPEKTDDEVTATPVVAKAEKTPVATQPQPGAVAG